MRKAHSIYGIALLTALILTGCGGGGGGHSAAATPIPAPAAPAASTLNIDFALKQLQFSWSNSSDATTYKLMENPDGVSGFTQVGADIPASQVKATQDIAVHKLDWTHAQYLVQACNATGCTNSNTVTATAGVLKTIGYFKASNTSSGDAFGYSVAISADGNTLAVGALYESSAAIGVNGDQQDNNAHSAGAVYVFSHDSGNWVQQAYLKASNTEAFDQFGFAITLSADGNTLAVGAPSEDSAGNSQSDNTASSSGAVYIFSRTNAAWGQPTFIKESKPNSASISGDHFGGAVALSNDGNTLAVGAAGTDSGTGATVIFSRTGATWNQQAYLKAFNAGVGDAFGISVALSGDGNTLAVGAWGEASSLTGVNNSGADNNDKISSGAAYVFTRDSNWGQQAYIKAHYVRANDGFGYAVALSTDGNTLAVTSGDQSGAKGINGDPSIPGNGGSGAAYVFSRASSIWSQQVYIKASNNAGANENFGTSIALSGDGNTLAVGAPQESSAAVGINGNEADISTQYAGAAYLFKRDPAMSWTQQRYIKAPTTDANDLFGYSVTLSSDSNTLAIGALGEASSAKDIGGDQTNNSAPGAGAVDLY